MLLLMLMNTLYFPPINGCTCLYLQHILVSVVFLLLTNVPVLVFDAVCHIHQFLSCLTSGKHNPLHPHPKKPRLKSLMDGLRGRSEPRMSDDRWPCVPPPPHTCLCLGGFPPWAASVFQNRMERRERLELKHDTLMTWTTTKNCTPPQLFFPL